MNDTDGKNNNRVTVEIFGIRYPLKGVNDVESIKTAATMVDERMRSLLKQNQYSPLPISLMSVSLFAVNSGFLDDIEVKDVLPFEAELHAYMKENYSDLLRRIDENKKLDKDDESTLAAAITDFKQVRAKEVA